MNLSYENFLSDEEIEKIKKIMRKKRDIMSYLDINALIDGTREIIAKSDIFDFRSSVAKLYIDKNQPVFTLKIKDEKLYQEVMNDPSPRDRIAKLLETDIIRHISELLTYSLDNNSELFKDVPEELTKLILTNIYVIWSSPEDNNIQLKFFK